MAIVRYSPARRSLFPEFSVRPSTLFEEMDRFLGEGFWPTRTTWTSLCLPVDMIEKEDELLLWVDLPGVKKDAIEVTIQEGMLHLKAERPAEEIKGDYYMRERSCGSFLRSIELPFTVDADKVEATYEDGILKLRLPKAEEARAKHIKVALK